MSALFNFLLNQGDQFRRARLPSLYSDFAPQRSSNPDGFAANVAVWQDVLAKAARAGVLPADGGSSMDTLSLKTGEALLQALETKEWGRPLALGTVIDESIAHRQLVPYQDFITAPNNIYNRTWTVHPWWLLSWGLKQLGVIGSSISAGILPRGQFVVMANVEQAGGKVIAQMAAATNQTDRIYPMKTFREKAGHAMGLNGAISENDLTILLTNLSRDKGAVVCDGEAVKFKAPGEHSATLSKEDKTIAYLKVLIADLNDQVSLLSKKISDLTATAQKAVGRNDRMSALAALKSKRTNETILVQRMNTLSRLEEVFHQIEQAHDQVAIVQVMESSTSVLRKLRAQTGGVKKVEGIVEDLRQEMQQVDEIGSVIEAGGQFDAIDEDAVDEELEQMMQQAKAKEGQKEAQGTKQRLAEIESSKATLTQPVEAGQSPVDAGIEALKRLSLDNEPARPKQSSSSIAPQIEFAPGA